MEQAGIDRKLTLIWNAIPGWNGTIKIVKGEFDEGRKALSALFPLLPDLRVVILVGRKAERFRPEIESRGLKIVASAHPSPKVRAIYPEKWKSIPAIWKSALTQLDEAPVSDFSE